MDPDEVNEIYAALAAALPAVGLEWIADQVETEVVAGLTYPAESDYSTDRDHPSLFRPPISFDSVRSIPVKQTLNTREYRPLERLDLLIEAIRRAVRESAALHSAVRESLGELRIENDEVVSDVVLGAPGEPGARDGRPILFDTVVPDSDVVNRLDALLDELATRIREP